MLNENEIASILYQMVSDSSVNNKPMYLADITRLSEEIGVLKLKNTALYELLARLAQNNEKSELKAV